MHRMAVFPLLNLFTDAFYRPPLWPHSRARKNFVLFTSEQSERINSSKIGMQSRVEDIMPNNSHQTAAEFHELAAHAHRAAAAHHAKEDHETGREHSRRALEHSNTAFLWSQEAHWKSVKATEEAQV
jgi:hypothetical protein